MSELSCCVPWAQIIASATGFTRRTQVWGVRVRVWVEDRCGIYSTGSPAAGFRRRVTV